MFFVYRKKIICFVRLKAGGNDKSKGGSYLQRARADASRRDRL